MGGQHMAPRQPKLKHRRLWRYVLACGVFLVLTAIVVAVSYWLWRTIGIILLYTSLGIFTAIITLISPLYKSLFQWLKARLKEEQEHFRTQVWNVPYQRNRYFTGREYLLKQLHNDLTRGRSAALTQTQAINGLGGIGKTQIAVEYAHRHRHEYHYILWANATTRETLVADFIAIASLLQLPEQNESEQSKIINAVKCWLNEHDGWLLILDNADDLNMAYTLLPTGNRGHILLTTREQAMGKLANSIEVQEMNKEEGTLMLLRRAKVLAYSAPLNKSTEQERVQAETIVSEMGGLPLALDQAGAYIEENKCTLAAYLDAYKRRQADMLRQRGRHSDDHPDPVATTWSLNFEQVERNRPIAADLMRFCAFLAPDDIPEQLIIDGANELSPLLKSIASDPSQLDEAIGELRRFSLIRRHSGSLSIHRLIQAVLKSTMNKDEQREWAEQTIRAIDRAFPKIKPSTWSEYERYLPHTLACAALIDQWNIRSEKVAWFLNEIGNYLSERRRYAEAEPLYLRALTIDEQTFGPEHIEVANDLNNLAFLYHAQSKYDQAEPLYQRALTLREQQLESNHPDIVTCLDNLALLYQVQGKDEEAEPLFQRALAIREQVPGPNHPDTAVSLRNLASLYQAQSKYNQAEPLLQRALAIWEQVLGPEHPHTRAIRENYRDLLGEIERKLV